MKKTFFILLVVLVMVAGAIIYLKQNPKLINKQVGKTAPAPSVAKFPAGKATTPIPTADETLILKNFIKQALVDKHGSNAAQLTITVSKIEGDFAQGGASGEGGGGMWFAAKDKGGWNLVWDGNGVILCQDLAAYPDFPTDMIPECYNETTGRTVKR